MRYYTERPRRGKNRTKVPYMLFVIIAILIVFNSFLYLFQKNILLTVLYIEEKFIRCGVIKFIK